MDEINGGVELPPLEIEQYKLENGLRVVLNLDNSIPVVAVGGFSKVRS